MHPIPYPYLPSPNLDRIRYLSDISFVGQVRRGTRSKWELLITSMSLLIYITIYIYIHSWANSTLIAEGAPQSSLGRPSPTQTAAAATPYRIGWFLLSHNRAYSGTLSYPPPQHRTSKISSPRWCTAARQEATTPAPECSNNPTTQYVQWRMASPAWSPQPSPDLISVPTSISLSLCPASSARSPSTWCSL